MFNWTYNIEGEYFTAETIVGYSFVGIWSKKKELLIQLGFHYFKSGGDWKLFFKHKILLPSLDDEKK